MKNYSVFLATTGGPVQIQRLTHEIAPNSTMCIGGSLESLPISNSYHDFIKLGTGVINREFGLKETSIRADVSGQIDTGNSWQLAFYLAHAIDADQNSSITGDIDKADHIIWATGTIDYDLNVGPVDYVSQKLEKSTELIQKLSTKTKEMTIIISDDQPETISWSTPLFANTTIIKVANADDALDKLSIVKTRFEDGPTEKAKQGKKSWPLFLFIFCFMAAVGSLIWAKPELISSYSKKETLIEKPTTVIKNVKKKKPTTIQKTTQSQINNKKETPIVTPTVNNIAVDTSKPLPKKNIQVVISAHTPQIGHSCKSITFGDKKPVFRYLGQKIPGTIDQISHKKVCKLSFSINETRKNRYVYLHFSLISGRIIRARVPKQLKGLNLFTSLQTWTIELPTKQSGNLEYSVAILSATKPISEEVKVLKKPIDWTVAKKTFASQNIDVLSLYHKLTP